MEPARVTSAELAAAREASGPPPVSILAILRGRRVDPLQRWCRLRVDYGDVARYRYGLSDNYFVSSADGVKRILQDNAANYTKEHASYRMLRRLFGNGLFTSEGSFWLRQRRLAQPAFHKQRLAAMGAAMVAAARDTARQWEAAASSQRPLSLVAEMSKLTLRIVGDALFGAALSAKAQAVAASWEVLNRQLVERHTNMRIIPPVLPTRYDRDFRRARRTLFGIVDGIIAARRADGGESDDLLSMFMSARDADSGERMTDGQLRDEVVTMLLAGHETTAVALAWVWARLDHHPEVRARLDDELGRVLGGRDPDVADLPSLPYTRAVIAETLRLHPPAYILLRHVVDDDVVCGHRIHKGGAVVMSPLTLQRDPEYWERPDDYLPERWLDDEAEKRRPFFAYIPFSAGPRQCIGNNFSLMESALALATLAQRFAPRLVERRLPAMQYLVLARPAGDVEALISSSSRSSRATRSPSSAG
jgi:cytochrome P450